MQSKLERDARFLKIYATLATVVGIMLLSSGFAFQQTPRQKFEEIDVERINIVEKDGKLRMINPIGNASIRELLTGKSYPDRTEHAWNDFFSIIKGMKLVGSYLMKMAAMGIFFSSGFDKSHQDQTLALRHLEGDNGQYFAGLQIWDRPNNSLADLFTRYETVPAAGRFGEGCSHERA